MAQTNVVQLFPNDSGSVRELISERVDFRSNPNTSSGSINEPYGEWLNIYRVHNEGPATLEEGWIGTPSIRGWTFVNSSVNTDRVSEKIIVTPEKISEEAAGINTVYRNVGAVGLLAMAACFIGNWVTDMVFIDNTIGVCFSLVFLTCFTMGFAAERR